MSMELSGSGSGIGLLSLMSQTFWDTPAEDLVVFSS
jgi:hypothetical protein